MRPSPSPAATTTTPIRARTNSKAASYKRLSTGTKTRNARSVSHSSACLLLGRAGSLTLVFSLLQLARKRRDLSILKTWTHYNTRDLDRVDQIEDILLLSVIYEALERAKLHTSLPKLQEADQNLCGGQIAFVFGQKAGAPAPAAVVSGDE